MIITKMIRGETKVLDEKEGLVSAVASTEVPDRDGDIIRASGWQLENFLKHPILLSSHNYGSVRSQIGEWTKLEIRGTKLMGTAKYYIGDGNEEADWAFKLATKGRGAYSVGFIPDMDLAEQRKGGKGNEFKGQELLEISHVTVPSNPSALQVMRGMVDPALQAIIDEQLAEAGYDQESAPNHYSEQAIQAGIRQVVRDILAEYALSSGSGSGPLPPESESDPLDFSTLIGGNNAH